MATDVTETYRHIAESIRRRDPVPDVELMLEDFWASRITRTPGVSLTQFDQGEAIYVFDLADGSGAVHEPRTLGAWTFARTPDVPRDLSYQRGYPNEVVGERATDRGHLIPFTAGGLLGPNVYIQDRALNRGWSDDGKKYRRIERAAVAAEAFFFCALIYGDDTAYPFAVELGVVLDQELRVSAFQNRFGSPADEMFTQFVAAGPV
jgi:hypothetical protein